MAATTGDFAAYLDIGEEGLTRLTMFVLRRLSERERAAQDVASSAVVDFVSQVRFGDIEPDEDLWPLLLEVAQRHCWKHNRCRSRRKKKGWLAAFFSVLSGPEGDFQPTDDTDELERIQGELFEEVMIRLEREGWDRTKMKVLRLKLAGHTVKEIAAGTGYLEGHVKTLLRHARRVVKKCNEEARQ